MLRDSQSEFCPGGGNEKVFPVNSPTHSLVGGLLVLKVIFFPHSLAFILLDNLKCSSKVAFAFPFCSFSHL